MKIVKSNVCIKNVRNYKYSCKIVNLDVITWYRSEKTAKDQELQHDEVTN